MCRARFLGSERCFGAGSGKRANGTDLRTSFARSRPLTPFARPAEMSYALCGDNPLCVNEQDKFDVLMSLVNSWGAMPGPSRVQFLDALCTSMVCLSAWMDGVLSSEEGSDDRTLMGEYRSAYKIYIFVAQWIAKLSSRETERGGALGEKHKRGKKKALSSQFDWPEQAAKLLKSVGRCMALDLWKVFRPNRPEDAVLISLIQLSTNILSLPSCAKDPESVLHGAQVLGLTALRYQKVDEVAAAVVELLNQYEHTPTMVAEILRYSIAEWDDGRLAALVIQEIASTDPLEYERQQNATGEKAGVRSVATFVDEVSARLPKLMATQISLLLPHLGGKAWTLRSGIIAAIGHLLAKAFDGAEDSNEKEDTEATVARLRTKQHLLDILCERTRDQSSYTRKAVLQTWEQLAQNRAIPLGHWQVVTSIATGRLEDKSSLVRKEAMRLMSCLMLHNPFGPSLPLDKFRASLELHTGMLEQVMAVDCNEVEVPSVAAADVGDAGDAMLGEVKVEDDEGGRPEPHGADEAPETHGTDGEEDEASGSPRFHVTAKTCAQVGWDGTVEELQALVASLELAVDFSKSLTASMPSLVNLLASSTVSDVQDSIALLLTCKQFEIVGAPEAIRKMLTLIFSREQNVKDKVIEALDQLYLSGWAGNSFTSQQAAQNLVDLACGATLGELGSLEEVVKCFHAKGLITVVTAHELWEIAEKNSREIHMPDADVLSALTQLRGAMAMLSMTVGVIPSHDSLPVARVRLLLHIVFNMARGDALIARHACLALGRIGMDGFANTSYDEVRNDVYAALARAVVSSEVPDSVWYTVAEAALGALYALHPKPEDVSCAIVRTMADQAFAGRDQEDNPPPSRLASKVFFVIGEIALRHLVLVEKAAKHVRRARLDAERAIAEASGRTKEASGVDAGAGESLHDHNSDVEKDAGGAEVEDGRNHGDAAQGEQSDEDINAELGTGSVAADAELDNMKDAAEKQIVQLSNGIIKPFAKMVIGACHHPSFNTADPILKSSALLALTKLMVVDVKICEANLQLIFTLLHNRVVEASIRSNLVIALGDLALRFPNSLEPWTEHVYRPLGDPDVSVRKTAMMVLTHLILNDMMKVKGHIAKMAARLEDEDDRVSALASLFFHELAKKEYKGTSPIYNLLPDILSMLSQDTSLSNAQFQSVMQQLLVHIKKDKHGDALVEKLCQRFSATEDVAQWRNIAFCISQLPMSDKGVKKLTDGHPAYKNALEDEETSQTMLSIVARVKKSATKQESKELAEDLENKMLTIIAEWKQINGQAEEANEEAADANADADADAEAAGEEALDAESDGEDVDIDVENNDENVNGGKALAVPSLKSPTELPSEIEEEEDLIAAVKQLEVQNSSLA